MIVCWRVCIFVFVYVCGGDVGWCNIVAVPIVVSVLNALPVQKLDNIVMLHVNTDDGTKTNVLNIRMLNTAYWSYCCSYAHDVIVFILHQTAVNLHT